MLILLERLIIDSFIHLVAAFFLERFKGALVTQFSFFKVLLILKKDITDVVEAVRVVLVQVNSILIAQDGFIVHIEGAVRDAEEEKYLGGLELEPFIHFVKI